MSYEDVNAIHLIPLSQALLGANDATSELTNPAQPAAVSQVCYLSYRQECVHFRSDTAKSQETGSQKSKTLRRASEIAELHVLSTVANAA